MNPPKPWLIKICSLWIYISMFFLPYWYYYSNLDFWGPLAGLFYLALYIFGIKRRWSWQSFGLAIPIKQAVYASALLFILSGLSYYFIKKHCDEMGIHFTSRSLLSDDRFHGLSYAQILLQTVLEEVLFGMLSLSYAQKKFSFHKINTALGLSALFVFWHWARFAFNYQHTYHLAPWTLLSLFLLISFRNLLILKFQNIAYSCTLHFAWSLHFFGWYFVKSSQELSEAQRLDMLLSKSSVTMVALAAIAIFLYGYRKEFKFADNRAEASQARDLSRKFSSESIHH